MIRRFNEALNENPGEHFTPREVIRLMVRLLLAGASPGDVRVDDRAKLQRPGAILKVYDPAAGSGGMLTAAKDEIARLNEHADVYLYGQEVNPETYRPSSPATPAAVRVRSAAGFWSTTGWRPSWPSALL